MKGGRCEQRYRIKTKKGKREENTEGWTKHRKIEEINNESMVVVVGGNLFQRKNSISNNGCKGLLSVGNLTYNPIKYHANGNKI